MNRTRAVVSNSSTEYLQAVVDERDGLARKLRAQQLLVNGVFQHELYIKLIDDFLDTLDDILDEATMEDGE